MDRRARGKGVGKGAAGKGEGGLILAGDIGGTKTYLGLFERRGAYLELAREEGFENSGYNGIEEIISGFIGKGERVASATFGIACPVEGNRGEMTNLDWVVDGEGIKKRFRIGKVSLINDLEATGHGLEALPSEDLFMLQKGEPRQGNAALIAAGTGLGEAILFWDGQRHIPSATEGGHADFAPLAPVQAELLGYLTALHGGHVSYERVLSGPGLEDIYKFIRKKRRGREPERIRKRFKAEGTAPVIADEAINGTDAACFEALETFVMIYGAEAGNLALKSMPVAGLYVGGGIAPKILKALKKGIFIEAFRRKGRFEKLLSRVPVYVILNDRTALIGAAIHAASGGVEGAVKGIKYK